jgi:hypothetical protein
MKPHDPALRVDLRVRTEDLRRAIPPDPPRRTTDDSITAYMKAADSATSGRQRLERRYLDVGISALLNMLTRPDAPALLLEDHILVSIIVQPASVMPEDHG